MRKRKYVCLLGALAISMLLSTCDMETPTSYNPTPPDQVPAMSKQGGHGGSPPLPLLARVEALEAAVEVLEAFHFGPPGGGEDIDTDGDGFPDDEDCDPFDDSIYPGAPEICEDGVDNDCNGLADDDDPICGGPPADSTDSDNDGFPDDQDCDPFDDSIYPGAPEICDDGVDNDCNGLADNEDPICGAPPGGIDTDDDGIPDDQDCEPFDSNIYPGAPEHCSDGADNNCNGLTDNEDPLCGGIDTDDDGIPDDQDCDPTDASIYPGAPEICDGVDNDCDGIIDNDDVCGP